MTNNRKTPRADWLDYEGGFYFITICTTGMKHFFGKVVDGKMELSDVGRIVDYELANPSLHHPDIKITDYVVMPNHIHAIVRCDAPDPAEISNPGGLRTVNPAQRPVADEPRHVTRLCRYVGSMKSAVTRAARKINPAFGWQTRYHDHYIRGSHDFDNIRAYIANNPEKWEEDRFK